MGRGTSGLRSQDTDWTARTVLHEQETGRTETFPVTRGKRVRHVYVWACLEQHFGRLGHGCRRQEQAATGGGRHRRRCHVGRSGLRRTEQRLFVGQRHPDYPERQQHVDRPCRRRHAGVSAVAVDQRNLQRPAIQGFALAAQGGLAGGRPPPWLDSSDQCREIGHLAPAERFRGYGHPLLRAFQRPRRKSIGTHPETNEEHEGSQTAAPAHPERPRLCTCREGCHRVARSRAV